MGNNNNNTVVGPVIQNLTKVSFAKSKPKAKFESENASTGCERCPASAVNEMGTKNAGSGAQGLTSAGSTGTDDAEGENGDEADKNIINTNQNSQRYSRYPGQTDRMDLMHPD